jgi:small subunit ribosomal protein S4
MGDPRRIRKKYATPRQAFDRQRIDGDLKLIGKYGLRNMRSVWKHSTVLRNFRVNARHLLSMTEEDREIGETELLNRLQRMGLVTKNATLDDVLGLQIEDLLNRRLQTMVYRQGMAKTPYQARQMITHGHIRIGEQKVSSPGYIVSVNEDKNINFAPNSPYSDSGHVALPQKDQKQSGSKKSRSRGRSRSKRKRSSSSKKKSSPSKKSSKDNKSKKDNKK